MRAQAVGIIGVGLIGGSIGLAAIRAGYQVFLYDSAERSSVAAAGFPKAALCDSLPELVGRSDLIIIATPISAIPEIALRLAEMVAERQVVSDVASVKGPVAAVLRATLSARCQYVPSHPMAGSERSGVDAARVDLFDGAVTILCPEPSDKQTAVQLVTEFWEHLGTRVAISSLQDHDRMVAAVSHLPHLVAALLVNNAAEMDALRFSGPGFRDTTRVASGSPELWAGILSANADAIREQLVNFRVLLDKTLALLATKDMKQLEISLLEAKENRDQILL